MSDHFVGLTQMVNKPCDPPNDPVWRKRPMNSVRLWTIIVNRTPSPRPRAALAGAK